MAVSSAINVTIALPFLDRFAQNYVRLETKKLVFQMCACSRRENELAECQLDQLAQVVVSAVWVCSALCSCCHSLSHLLVVCALPYHIPHVCTFLRPCAVVVRVYKLSYY